MPAKNSRRVFVPGCFYHVYNRGVEKRVIFQDREDYVFFLSLLKRYLLPPDQQEPGVGPHLTYRIHEKVELHAYCLMPNHYHFLIKLLEQDGLTKFMRALNDAYVSYFNAKYERVGALYQGKYKAVLVRGEYYLLHLSRYIHRNPLGMVIDWGPTPNRPVALLVAYPYSSYQYYLSESGPLWLKMQEITGYFTTAKSYGLRGGHSYQSFVEDYGVDEGSVLGDMQLDGVTKLYLRGPTPNRPVARVRF